MLTDSFLIDHSIASATGMFDIFDRTWYEPALNLTGVTTNQFSQPISTTALLPTIKSQAAQRLNLSPDIPWVIGASDGCLANIGVKADAPAKAALTIGTSGAIRVTTETPRVDKDRRLFTYILDDNRYIMGGSINNGGIMMQWYKNHLMQQAGELSLSEHLAKTKAIPPGSDGLLCLPYLLGERAPNWNSFDRGVYFGVQFQHTGLHFLKALLEGITITLQQIGAAIEDNGGPIDQILANGGVLQSPEWLQIMANVFGKQVVVTPGQDASAVGAILLTQQVLGTVSDASDMVSSQQPAQLIEPDMEAHAVYQKILPIFVDLYAKLQDDFIRQQSS